jgi:hypothetical protein
MHWDGGDGGDADNPDVLIILITHGRQTCFYIAVPRGNNDIEDAKAVCCQAVLYRTTQGDADVYFAVLDIDLQAVHFCLCSPLQQEFEDVSRHAIEQEAEGVVERMKAYIVLNADVLSQTGMGCRWSRERIREAYSYGVVSGVRPISAVEDIDTRHVTLDARLQRGGGARVGVHLAARRPSC